VEDKTVRFECLVSCAGIDFSYQHGNVYSLGDKNSDTTMDEPTAKDLLRAQFIKKVESVERAVKAPAPVEMAVKTMTDKASKPTKETR
jgi:hypothetical protein